MLRQMGCVGLLDVDSDCIMYTCVYSNTCASVPVRVWKRE